MSNSEPILQNGKRLSEQKLPWWVFLKNHRKTPSKQSLIFSVVFWLIYIVVFAWSVHSTIVRVILTLVGVLSLVEPVYCLRKGIYLKPGNKKVQPKSQKPEDFLKKVKSEVGIKHAK